MNLIISILSLLAIIFVVGLIATFIRKVFTIVAFIVIVGLASVLIFNFLTHGAFLKALITFVISMFLIKPRNQTGYTGFVDNEGSEPFFLEDGEIIF